MSESSDSQQWVEQNSDEIENYIKTLDEEREQRAREADELAEYEAMKAAKEAAAEAKRIQEEAERESSLFNWSLYRALMKDRRQKLGYRDARMFARTIYLRTRIKIPAESYYKMESGKQGLKAEQFMALNIALWGNPWPEQIMALCTGVAWAEIASSPYPHVPRKWALENSKNDGISTDPEKWAYDFSEAEEAGAVHSNDSVLYGCDFPF